MITANEKSALDVALELNGAGISTVAILCDGEKSPAGAWKQWQDRRPTERELRSTYAGRKLGVAIVGGAVSGNVEAIDFDLPELIAPFKQIVCDVAPGLLERLAQIETPRGGLHLVLKCEAVGHNQKLAMFTPPGEKPKASIETRGEGGYFLTVGSPIECNRNAKGSGRVYRHVGGPWLTELQPITPGERDVLFEAARSFSEVVDEPTTAGDHSQPSGNGRTPGDDFNERATWGEILTAHGWRPSFSARDIQHWLRPGKDGAGTSATTGLKSSAGNELLCVFSTSAHPFDVPNGKTCGTYSKFAAFAILNHGGDYSAAARDLAARGYGDAEKPPRASADAGADAIAAMAPADAVTNGVKTKAEGDARAETFPLSMAAIIERTRKQTGDFPRRVASMLFVDDERHGLSILEKSSGLFGYLHSVVGKVEWHKSVGCATRDDFFAEQRRTATAYRGIETFPHYPPLTGHYYHRCKIETGDGSTLAKFLDFFTPATEIDRDLMLAAVVTMGWGGPPGARPAFAFTAKAGRGVGKTTAAQKVAMTHGGAFEVSLGEDIGALKKRLLTPEAATTRAILLDNIKSNEASWAEGEGLITCAEISGHRMYHGEAKRPNNFTWFLTLNGPSMSRDFAQRCVFIELAKPEHSAEWEERLNQFIEANRLAILGDVAAFFQRPAATLERCSRWGSWEKDVLARLPEPSDTQAVIAERQGQVDVEDERSREIEDHFRRMLEKLGYDPTTDNVHIPNTLAREWFCQAVGERASSTAVTRIIRQTSGEGLLKCLEINPCRSHGRGMIWNAGRGAATFYDIEHRQREQAWQGENRYWDR